MDKPRVVITVGLPRSGKSTWARKYVCEHENWVRVGKDDIREMLYCTVGFGPSRKGYDGVVDTLIRSIRNSIILLCLEAGKNVIIDGVHMHEDSLKNLRFLLRGKAKITMRYFTAPLEECLKRNAECDDGKVTDEYIKSLVSAIV